jgi:hypothetical protein
MEHRGLIPGELNAVVAALLPLVAVDEEDDSCDECLTRSAAAAEHDAASAVVGSSTTVMVIHFQNKGWAILSVVGMLSFFVLARTKLVE